MIESIAIDRSSKPSLEVFVLDIFDVETAKTCAVWENMVLFTFFASKESFSFLTVLGIPVGKLSSDGLR